MELFRSEGHNVEVKEVRVLERLSGEKLLMRSRIKLEATLDEDDLASLELESAESLQRDGRKLSEQDGPNTLKLGIKVKFAAGVYKFARQDYGEVTFQGGQVANQALLKFIDGQPSLVWWVEADLEGETLKYLSGLVRCSGVTLDTRPFQVEMPLGDEEQAKGKKKRGKRSSG